MPDVYTVDQTFEKADFRQDPLPKGEYECCTFSNCEFSETDLSGIKFVECTFNACNLSLAKVKGTAFRDVVFRDCKLMGLHFHQCASLGLNFSFSNCILSHASFYQLKIKKTAFKNSQLQHCDFTETDLSESLLENCDLLNAKFEKSILEKADLSSSFNYIIDPATNKIKKARFAQSGLAGLLANYDIIITD